MDTQNNLDILIAAACDEYCKIIAKEFLELDTTGFEITPAQRRRFYRILRASERKHKPRMSVGKIIAAACIIVLSVSITACVAIPKVREAIKRAVIEWRDKYITIEFVEETPESESVESTENATPASIFTETGKQDSNTTENTETLKPTKIEKKVYASYLPEGYTYTVDADTKLFYLTSYYNNDEMKFCLTQKIISQQSAWADSEGQTITHCDINGYQAILLENTDDPFLYMLVWQDSQYEYKLEGYFSDTDEILKVAKGIQLQ